MFVAMIVCGLAISSCKKDSDNPKPEPPTTKTVLTGMEVTGIMLYENLTYEYEYDSDYRLTGVLAYITNSPETVISDYDITYSDHRIVVNGTIETYGMLIDCDLDDEGRIVTMVRSTYHGDTLDVSRVMTYDYDEDGYLVKETQVIDAGEIVSVVTWEDDELKKINSSNGMLVSEYETSNAPTQVMFSRLGYDINMSDLCPQGVFGKLPKHLPSQRALSVYLNPQGEPFHTTITDYTYTVENNRVTKLIEKTDAIEASYTFTWEEK